MRSLCRLRKFFTLAYFWTLTATVMAEPWISTKMAQNCAGCHAPGRRNLEAADRRCSLSCQGCHVNPNGGGLRSHYGKWTENHWLKSVRSKALQQTATTAPLKKQKYYISVKGYKSKQATPAIKALKQQHPDGIKLVYSQLESPDPKFYDRKEDPYHDKLGPITHTDEKMHTIPLEDPFRQMLQNKVDGGMGLRWSILKRGEGDADATKTKTFFMSGDFAVRWRPVYKRYHLVYESRILGSPQVNNIDQNINNEFTRSLYFLVDDLPYNMFVMGGYYRPLFGNYVADHYALSQMMQANALTGGPAYAIQYKAMSIGTAPNVPYANVHVISKNMRAADVTKDKHQGIAANLGLRFVSYGASVNYSVWLSEDKTNSTLPTKILMHSIGAAATIFDFTLSLESVSLERDNQAQDYRKGGVTTLDLRYRVWREIYLTLEYAKSNVAQDLKPGKATQSKAGVKAFLLPGWEVSLQQNTDENTQSGVLAAEGISETTLTSKRTSTLGMIHVYL